MPSVRIARSGSRANGGYLRRSPSRAASLELVARGLTNRDIGAQLLLSPRTIDYHLRKVFTKLGIASRAELIRHGTPRPDPR